MKTNRVMNRDWRKKVAWFNAIVIFLIPLIVFYKRIEITEELKMYFGNVEAIGDFFAYYKAKLLQFGAPTSLALTIYFKRKEGWKFTWDNYTILLALFSCSIILSTIMSEHKMVAIFGYPDRFEGAWTWLSYLMFSYSIYLFVETKKDIINTIKPFVYATGVASFIGVLQFVGFDLFNTNFGKWLILGSNYNALAESLVFKFPKGTVYTTLYNPNYIGTMVAMVIPLIVFLFNEFEDSVHKMIMVLIFILNIISLLGSKSTGGLIGTSIVLLVMTIYFIWTSKYKIRIALTSLVLILVIVVLSTNTTLFERQLIRFRTLANISIPTEKVIKDIQIDGSNLKVISSDDEEINVYHDNENIFVYDNDGNLISDKMNKNGYFLAYQPPYDNWRVRYTKDDNKLRVSYRKDVEDDFVNVYLHLVKNGYTVFGKNLIEEEEEEVESIDLIKKENVFSFRGYIWNRSIPLLFENPILGNGSDVFAIKFPQKDLVGRANSRFKYNMIIDKVHNFILGVGMNFGLFGLTLVGYLLINAVYNMRSHLTLLLSLIGFLIVGMVNDSTVLMTFFVFVVFAVAESEYIRSS